MAFPILDQVGTIAESTIPLGETADKRRITVKVSLRCVLGNFQTVNHGTIVNPLSVAIGFEMGNGDWYSSYAGLCAYDAPAHPETYARPLELIAAIEAAHPSTLVPNCCHQEPLSPYTSERAAAETLKCPRGYRYGSSWLTRPMTCKTLMQITELMEIGRVKGNLSEIRQTAINGDGYLAEAEIPNPDPEPELPTVHDDVRRCAGLLVELIREASRTADYAVSESAHRYAYGLVTALNIRQEKIGRVAGARHLLDVLFSEPIGDLVMTEVARQFPPNDRQLWAGVNDKVILHLSYVPCELDWLTPIAGVDRAATVGVFTSMLERCHDSANAVRIRQEEREGNVGYLATCEQHAATDLGRLHGARLMLVTLIGKAAADELVGPLAEGQPDAVAKALRTDHHRD